LDGEVTYPEFQEAFVSVKEQKSLSPTGIHYTLWKSIATNDKISKYMATMMGMPF
jgi:hypothetical protein